MGQIIFNEQKPKYANLVAITTGTKSDVILNENEIWLIDSTNATKVNGKGNYDKYIKGDGQTAAKNLPLLNVVPTALSELADDATHRLVTDKDKQRWNSGTGGGGTPIESSEDITVINDAQEGINKLQFANKDFNSSNFSGLGKVYVRKNIQLVPKKTFATVFDTSVDDTSIYEGVTHVSGKTIECIKDINESEIGDTIIGKTISTSPSSWFSISYIKLNVKAGETYMLDAQISDSAHGIAWYSRFWFITGEVQNNTATVLQAYKPNYEEYLPEIRQEVDVFTVEQDGILWIDYVSYNYGHCKIYKIEDLEQTNTINVIQGIDKENTIYYIEHDFDLNGGVLVIPKNSVLYFVGGKISNGYIVGKHTLIRAGESDEIFSSDIKIYGKWSNYVWYAKWFSVFADGVTDDTDTLQNMLNLGVNINRGVLLNWQGLTFRTTHQLYLKNNTFVKGGTIKAKFENQMAWVMKTYNWYKAAGAVYGDLHPGALVSWQDHDRGYATQVNYSTIEDLTIIGEYNEHYTNGEFDGTYTPIFGGLCIMASGTINTKGVKISGVGVGLGRSACLKTMDTDLNINALFVGFAGYAINGHSIRDSYIKAYCRTGEVSSSSAINNLQYVTPYYPEYQTIVTMPSNPFIFGDGGIDLIEGNPRRPYFCNVQLLYGGSVEVEEPLNDSDINRVESANITLDNPLMDYYGEVFITASTDTNVTIRHAWIESLTKCIIWSYVSRVTMESPFVANRNEYDIYAERSVITLSGVSGDNGIKCQGGTTGDIKKYYLDSASRVNILDARVSPYPTDDDRFHFLSSGSVVGLPVSVIPSSGTGALTDNTLNAAPGTYYRFNYTVNTLIVNLPDMTGVSSVRPVILYVETGNEPNITFTSSDNKTVTQFSNYEVDMNSKYEINCLYNGQKWVVAAAVID